MKRTCARLVLVAGVLAFWACGRDEGAVSPTDGGADLLETTLDTAAPAFTVELYAWDGSNPSTETLRWKGTAEGPHPESPERSDRPFLGFGKPYLLRWAITAEQGLVVGHQHRASQVDPTAILSSPGLGLGDEVSFTFANEIPAEALPPGGCESGPDCPDRLRFASGSYDFQVYALDVLGTTRPYAPGLLDFDVNYPPESSIVVDQEWPRYAIENGQGEWVTASFAPGDTVPVGAYVTMRMGGYDRLEGSVSNPDSFCCDQKLDPLAPDVRFQGMLKLTGDEGFAVRRFQTLFSSPDVADTLGFWVGPFAYEFLARAADEHDRRDPTPETTEFMAGFPPRVLALEPEEGRSMVLRDPLQGSWAENEIPYDLPSGSVIRYWDGIQFFDEPGENRTQVVGHVFRLKPRFEGAADPREPHGAIHAWAYALFSEHDPDNLLVNGCCESPDLSFYLTSPEENVWAFSDDEAVELFVPIPIWYLPELFEPESDILHFRQIGEWLRRHLALNTLQVVGRTTQIGEDDFKLYTNVRPEGNFVPIDIERMGRRTETAEVHFSIHLGLDPDNTGSIQRRWPDY